MMPAIKIEKLIATFKKKFIKPNIAYYIKGLNLKVAGKLAGSEGLHPVSRLLFLRRYHHPLWKVQLVYWLSWWSLLLCPQYWKEPSVYLHCGCSRPRGLF